MYVLSKVEGNKAHKVNDVKSQHSICELRGYGVALEYP